MESTGLLCLVPTAVAESPSKAELSPGRSLESGDFIWYDPCTRSAITGEVAKSISNNRRTMPEGRTVGFVYTAEPPASGQTSEGA